MITCKWFVWLGIGACSLPLVPWGMAMTAPDRSAEGGEVEVHGDRVTFGRKDADGGGIGGEGIGGELKFQRGAHGSAGAMPSAAVEWMAPGNRRGNHLVAVIHLDSEIFPEVVGARDESGRRTGARASWIMDESSIGWSEIDFDRDLDGLLLMEVIEAGLLSAVAADA